MTVGHVSDIFDHSAYFIDTRLKKRLFNFKEEGTETINALYIKVQQQIPELSKSRVPAEPSFLTTTTTCFQFLSL